MLLEVLTGLYLTRDQVSWSKAGGGGAAGFKQQIFTTSTTKLELQAMPFTTDPDTQRGQIMFGTTDKDEASRMLCTRT